MKKIITLAAALSAVLSIASCEMEKPSKAQEMGTLSFDGFDIEVDDAVVTKAVSAASGNYTIFIYDANGDEYLRTTYSAVKAADNKISLPGGDYTLEARSTEDAVPTAAFEQPVYGATKEFSISAGETSSIGSITCSLLQCKVTVSYSDEFLDMVTGDGTATVELTAGSPLVYDLKYNNGSVSYEQSAGYFAVTGSTIEISFKGSIEGSSKKMTKVISNVEARQWRQIKFVKKVEEEGNGTFYVTIDDLVDDVELNNDIIGGESIIGDDPDAPKGDGGITLELDYADGCDTDITDLNYILMPQPSEKKVSLVLKATVPNGVKKFGVNIQSTSESFVAALEAADAVNLDLINPTEDNMIIFQVVPFPYGQDLVGQTELVFDLSAAQEAIVLYQGQHNFEMVITDQQGCKKAIPVVMVVL